MTRIVLVALTLIIPSLANAAEKRSATVHGAPPSLMEDLRQGEPNWLFETVSTGAVSESKNPGKALFEKGRQAYEQLLFEEALPLFQESRREYEKRTLDAEGHNEYVQLLAHTALLYEATGNSDGAAAMIKRLARLQPDLSFLDHKYPPKFRETLRAEVARLPAKTAALRVESRPEGATVYINGRLRGSTPTVIKDLHGGRHVVEVRRDGYVPVRRDIELRGGFGIGAEATPDLMEFTLVPSTSDASKALIASLHRGEKPSKKSIADAVTHLRKNEHNAAVYFAATTSATIACLIRSSGSVVHRSFPKDALDIPPLQKRVIQWTRESLEEPKQVDIRPKVKPALPSESVNARMTQPASTEEPSGDEGLNWWLWGGTGATILGGIAAAVYASQPAETPPQTGTAVIRWE